MSVRIVLVLSLSVVVYFVDSVQLLADEETFAKTVGLVVFELVAERLESGYGFKDGAIHYRDACA